MANYFSLRDGLITDTSTYGISISSVEKTNNTSSYTLTTSDNWSTVLSSANTDVIDSIAVHLSSRAATPVGVLSAQVEQYAGIVTKVNTSITEDSISFAGNGYASVPANTIVLGAGDFTVEMWIKTTVTTLAGGFARTLFLLGAIGSANALRIFLSHIPAGQLRVDSNVPLLSSVNATLADNNWNHICVLREGTTMRLFVNGVQSGNTATNSSNFNGGVNNPLFIGSISSNTGNYSGLISNVRVVVGSAITPSPLPTQPLSIVNNTSFLFQSPYVAYKNSNTYSNTLVGTYPISSFTSYDGSDNSVATYPLNWQLLKLSSPFTNSSRFFSLNLKTSDADQLSLMGLSTVNGIDYDRICIVDSDILSGSLTKTGTTLSAISPFGEGVDGSLYFNGTTTDGVTVNKPISFAGDFTIECWTYTSNTSGAFGRPIFDNRPNNNNTSGSMYLGFAENSNKLLIDRSVGTRVTVASSSDPFPLNQWVHVAYSRSANMGRLYVGGALKHTVTDSNVYNSSSSSRIGRGAYVNPENQVYFGYISNFRIIQGEGIYTGSSITPPSSPLNVYSKLRSGGAAYTELLYKSPYSTTFLYNVPVDNIHLCSLLNGYDTQTITVTADSATIDNLYIHNKGTLTFPSLTSTSLTLDGSNGLQVTSDGTLQIGTSSNPVPSNVTHQLNLSNNHLGVHNGGRLDVYGAYKVPYTKLTAPSISTARVFTVTDAVSSNWRANDTVVFTPNTAVSTSYDTLILSSFDSDNTFRTTASAAFAHSTLSYVPSIANMTRNVKIGGTSTSARGNIQSKGAAVVNLNNVEFKNIDTSLETGVNNNGLFTLSGCTLSGTGVETLVAPMDTEFSGDFNGVISTNRANISYITAPANNTDYDVNVGTDFTLEVFTSITSHVTAHSIINVSRPNITGTDALTEVPPQYAFALSIQLNRSVTFTSYTTTFRGFSSPANSIQLNKWHHIAIVGRNSTNHMYIDGELMATAPQYSWNFASDFITKIGYSSSFNNVNNIPCFKGKMSNLRFVKGEAVYTGNFTPPTEPLTERTGAGITTAILTLQDKTIVDNSYRNATLTTNLFNTVLDSPFGKDQINASIDSNVIFKAQYGLKLENVASQNASITNNLILSSKDAGVYLDDGLKGNLSFGNNVAVGPSPYGSFIQNNTTGATLSGLVNYNNTRGFYLYSSQAGVINNVINTYNSQNGVLVDGTISQLNETTFTNITASNNRTVGFFVSGNEVNHLSPITLNINGLVANNNLSGGFEGYCITGNLTSLQLNGNGIYGMKTSIGNYYTTIDGITALMNNVAGTSAAIGILSATNYYPTIIRNANVGKAVGSSIFGAGISLDSTKFSQFHVYNSTVSGGSSDFQLRTTRGVLEGSYLISNTNIGNLPVGTGVNSSNYQSDVLKTTGFAFTNMNNASGYNTTYLAAGTRAVDSTIKGNISETTSPSERLTPRSTTLKLRSGSKFVALDANQSTTVRVRVRKSDTIHGDNETYNGSAPRLILKRNGAMGINSDMVIDQLDAVSNEFLTLFGTTQTVTDAGVLEFYVDCDGTTGWVNVDNWTAN